jgi:hypothetical protein
MDGKVKRGFNEAQNHDWQRTGQTFCLFAAFHSLARPDPPARYLKFQLQPLTPSEKRRRPGWNDKSGKFTV